ncbi:selenium cofactor biosynthesis protein YqeC [Klebsiella aerogenes]|uniref:selenium cofactor biosynthesis protein YqeC n=1 Tax=Klebsiella aerogenes TaxID=548 RepID=UPI000667D999|nr:selenium cofactor biosynthesis protein YqeC [Klebsiella aerogenes]MEB6106983.1 selenium cofactor biosynthesis protein YqeC [Klebsiella aerogenes]MEB6597713.1 selenium cofactor biosynthesis protein YqeC [Klebsiella aerogenes]QDK15223.1 putative selenium-dependent hydroxylase accessory protein YqeC [Klebsiella aerogenes]HDS2185300.1 putative selenium-dependent hydroxylase accessory protein YqeC [Klebsiella aerogenes]HDS4381692.1 putative selenium-dependent hydroxylase accessory protein YqeC [
MENIPHLQSLFCDLGVNDGPLLISAVGAGGKTSTLMWLAQRFLEAGRRVLITTTTHMYLPASLPVVICREPLALPVEVWQRPLQACYASWLAPAGKVRGFSPQQLDALVAAGRVDVVLVEADGAHGFALKAPAEHEPCIPQSCCCVIAVMGAWRLGQNVGPATVHRWPLFSRITGAAPDTALSWPMLHRLITHPQGAFKGVPPASRRILLLNQLSQNENLPEQALLQQWGVNALWAGAVQEHPAITRRRTTE